MMTYVHLFIIGTFIRTCLAITYELNTSQPIGRTLNIRGISLAPFPVRTQNNKTVDMVIALQQQSLYITNAINYNPDIRYICNCVILRVNWVQDGIFVVTNRMVMLISPYNFRNITIMNTDQNIIYAQYGSKLNVNYIAISFNNRIQLFQNTVSIYNFTTKSPCKVLTFDVLTSYLHFYDDNLHHTLFIQTLNLTSTPISIGVTVSIIPEAQYRVLSLTANGYLSEWNQSYLVFQKLLDSSLSKSTRMFLFLTTGFEFLAIYAQEGLAGSLKLWQYESNQNVLLNFHKNIAFKQGIKSISSQNNKIAILNDDNEYKILSRVQSGASGMNIWWIILPSSALVLILVIVVIIKIKMRAKKPNKESKYENVSAVKEKEKEKEKKIEKEVKKYQQEEKIVEKKKGLSKLEQKLIREGGEGGELEEQRIYNIENIYANVSAIDGRGEQNESKTKTKKKYRLKQKDEEKDTKGKQTKSKYTNYYQFNSQIDEYTKVDRAPQ